MPAPMIIIDVSIAASWIDSGILYRGSMCPVTDSEIKDSNKIRALLQYES
jgi:hypothetical protein